MSEFQDLFADFQKSTYTVLAKDIRCYEHKKPQPSFSYQLHTLFCQALGASPDTFSDTLQDKSTEFLDRFLDRCIEIAENEDI